MYVVPYLEHQTHILYTRSSDHKTLAVSFLLCIYFPPAEHVCHHSGCAPEEKRISHEKPSKTVAASASSSFALALYVKCNVQSCLPLAKVPYGFSDWFVSILLHQLFAPRRFLLTRNKVLPTYSSFLFVWVSIEKKIISLRSIRFLPSWCRVVEIGP